MLVERENRFVLIFFRQYAVDNYTVRFRSLSSVSSSQPFVLECSICVYIGKRGESMNTNMCSVYFKAQYQLYLRCLRT